MAKHEGSGQPGEAAKPASAKAKPEEAGAAKEAEPKAKPARHKPVSPVVPEAAPAAAPEASHAQAPKHPAPRHPSRAPKRPLAVPALAQVIPAAEVQVARLQAENAVLRQRLSLSKQPPSQEIGSPEAALAELAAGNQRFVEGGRVRTLMSMQDVDLRATLAKGQAPFAVIITCSDSRLADNLIFDQELGRLFTIREAGNSPDTQSLASVEYALEHLGSRIVVVMGHSRCGAVQAVSDAHGKPLPGNLWSLQAAMSGLLESTPEDPNEDAGTHMNRLIQHNAQRQAQAVLARSEIVRDLVAKGKVLVVPAVYDLASGKVVFGAAPAATAPAEPAHH